MTFPASNTADYIIQNAMYDAGLIEIGSTPTAAQYAMYLPRLNDVINELQTGGLKLFLMELVQIPLVAAQALYTLGPAGNVVMTKPLRVVDAYYVNLTGGKIPLNIISMEDYIRLGNVTTQGQPTSLAIDKQQLTLNVNVWNVPNAFTVANGTLWVWVTTQINQYTAITSLTAFPVEWTICLRWCLAADLATGQPDSVMQRCELKAAFFREKLENWDVDDASTMFTYNTLAQTSVGTWN